MYGNRGGFRGWLYRFMAGRYGVDLFGRILMWVCIALVVINLFVGSIWIGLIETAIMCYAIFRIMSRNINARVRENAFWLRLAGKFRNRRALSRAKRRDRATHVYKRCPSCKNTLRLPRQKGPHTVRCPRCQHLFDIKIR